MNLTGACPDCGSQLSAEQWSRGLCLSCLLDLGLSADAIAAAGESQNVPTRAPVAPLLSGGQILGERYRIRALLGRGGMGEVFRAFDLKLRVDVALKAMRPGLVADDRGQAGLRQEVRAAREVVSPNVCRVFDLVDFDGHELVSMEFVDGVTLADVLRDRSPLALQEARDIASQFLAGLEAIHGAGLVHRDIKPENVMLTRAGRVIVMDFGIARALVSGSGGTIAGTPAYMAPEQARGDAVDASADVFSAGVLLAEMVAASGARTQAARDAIWRGVHDQPPRVGDSPWAPVLRKAVAHGSDQRYSTAAALSRALDEVTLRTTGDESQRPYPGLAAFTERDAEYFVGRELEIEELWKKLRRPHLLGLIGPSGAGKSSFLRAGLGHTAPPGWRIVFATPGDRPFAALAHALAPELSGDVEAIARLIDFEQPDVAVDIVAGWRRRHDHALVVFDQFEELFTQSPPAVQERCTQLLARLALEADVHVLLSMRDDFLFHCKTFESLAPVFSDLMAMGPPTGAALRRALVQPALKCGYRFEDEAVVEQMLAQVAGERGALPLVAFAMSRLWERRDRERGLLTRAAYDEIGGVGGALAQHAEATLERIGQERVPIVRELVRNLVTAQGTRATVDRDELLSVFSDDTPANVPGPSESPRRQAADVLDALVDARLLTSYELPSDAREAAGHRRIEIVHESLLTAWPRLVRWQTQDQDGAQLRDQMRQAARLWEERGKPDDLLWTGTSFREYELWRERYAGALSSGEGQFAHAMTARARRRRRQRVASLAAVITAAIAVAVSTTVLWRQSENARARALDAAQHAASQQLLTLGQLELAEHPSSAVAYALASLERNDSPQARRFALRGLWRGPTAFVLDKTEQILAGETGLSFSPDGEWLALVSNATGAVRVWKNDGSVAANIPGSGGRGRFAWMDFSADSRSLVITQSDSIRIVSLPSMRESRRITGSFRWGLVRGQSVITGAFVDPLPDGRARRRIKSFPLPDGTPETDLGIHTGAPGALGPMAIDPAGHSLLAVYGGQLYDVPLRQLDHPQRRVPLRGDDPISWFGVSSDGARLYAWRDGLVGRVWSRETGLALPGPHLLLAAERRFGAPAPSPDGRWLAATSGTPVTQLWDLRGPVEVEPATLRATAPTVVAAFDATGSWLAVQDQRSLSLWPLTTSQPHVLRTPTKAVRDVAVDPQGRWVAAGSSSADGVFVWPTRADLNKERITLDGVVRRDLARRFSQGRIAGSGHGVRGLAGSPRWRRSAETSRLQQPRLGSRLRQGWAPTRRRWGRPGRQRRSG